MKKGDQDLIIHQLNEEAIKWKKESKFWEWVSDNYCLISDGIYKHRRFEQGKEISMDIKQLRNKYNVFVEFEKLTKKNAGETG